MTGAKIAISVSPAPLFLGFGGVSPPPPPPHFGGGESLFEGFGVWSDGMLRPFSFFRAYFMLWVLGDGHIIFGVQRFAGLFLALWFVGWQPPPPPFEFEEFSFETCILQISCVPCPHQIATCLWQVCQVHSVPLHPP